MNIELILFAVGVLLAVFLISYGIYIFISKGFCVCANCVSSRLNTTDPFGYVPCVHSHPSIKLAHHRTTIKTKSYIAYVKKGQA